MILYAQNSVANSNVVLRHLFWLNSMCMAGTIQVNNTIFFTPLASMLGSVGKTAGIIAAVVAVVFILIIIIYCCCCRKKNKEEEYVMG